jgi:hypothetical protein
VVWDSAGHKQVRSITLDSEISSIAYSADGALIAVGFSGGGRKGSVQVFGTEENNLVLKGTAGTGGEGSPAATDVKFGLSAYLAVGTDLGKVMLYSLEVNAENAFALLTSLDSGSSAAITRFDISAAGSEIIAANASDDLVFFRKPTEPEGSQWGKCDPFTGTKEAPAPEFPTLTNPLSRGLQGLYGPNGSGSYTSVARPKNGAGVVAASDSAGLISLFPFPSSRFAAGGRSVFSAHDGGVSSIAFTSDDATLLSAGTIDGCIFQWSFSPDEGGDSASSCRSTRATTRTCWTARRSPELSPRSTSRRMRPPSRPSRASRRHSCPQTPRLTSRIAACRPTTCPCRGCTESPPSRLATLFATQGTGTSSTLLAQCASSLTRNPSRSNTSTATRMR